MDWGRALRVVVGVITPFGIGLLTGHLTYGAFASLGALPAGFVSFQGSSRSRLSAIAVASAGMALSTFAGSVAAAYLRWSMVPAVAVVGYACGLSVSLDQRLSVAALQAGVALEVAVGVPLGPGPAAVRAGLVLAGGLLQGALVVGTWALSPGANERRALAASYQELASYAARLAAGDVGAPSPAALPARRFVEDPNPLLGAGQRLAMVDLLEEAERLRASLAAMAAYTEGPALLGQARPVYQAAAGLLAEMAGLLAERRPRGGAAAAAPVAERARQLRLPAGQLTWRWLGEALLGQLRAVPGILARLEAGQLSLNGLDAGRLSRSVFAGRRSSLGVPVARRPRAGHRSHAGVMGTLRANMSLDSEAGRHALRLGVACAATEALVLGTGLREGRWAVLTVFIVLKPDYAGTLQRGARRALGTAVGAGLGIVIVQFGHLGPAEMMVAAGLAVAAAYAIFDISYLVFSVWLTAFVVLLLDILGTPALPVAGERLANTAIGAAVALVAFAVWPTWEGRTAHEKFACLLEAHALYLAALLGCSRPAAQWRPADLRRLQLSARRARSDAEASAQRLVREPSRAGQLGRGTAAALAGTVRRLASVELVFHTLADPGAGAAPPDGGPGRPVPGLPAESSGLRQMCKGVRDALEQMAGSLRRLEKPPCPFELRQRYEQVRAAGGVAGPALEALDSLVDVVDTMADVLCRDLGGLPPPAVSGPADRSAGG